MSEVVIVDGDDRALYKLAIAFRGTPYEITAVEPVRTIRTAMRLAQRSPAAMVVSLKEAENIAEIRALLEASTRTRVLFLVPSMPPSAALSRIVHTYRAGILSCDEAPIVIVASLIALMADDQSLEGGGRA